MSIESTSILQYTQMMPYDKHGQKYVDTTPPLHINAMPLERDVQQAQCQMSTNFWPSTVC